MLIRQAIQSDSPALIKLSALAPMKGSIGLRIDRNPDFFNLLKERGSFKVFVAEDSNGDIMGSFSAALQYFCINQHTRPVHYLCDLKIHPSQKSTTLAFRLVKEMHRYLKDTGADLLFCTAADGNHPVMNFFEGRAGIPMFKNSANFIVNQILPRKLSEHIAFQEENDTGLLVDFYNRYYSSYCFRPAIDRIIGCTNFSMRRGNELKAAVSVYDPALLKQNVLVRYPFSTSIALSLLRFAKTFFPLPPIPSKREPLRILYVKYFGFAPEEESAFLHLIQEARHFAYLNNYHFLSIGIDEKDIFLNKLIKPLSRFQFRSTGMISSLRNDTGILESIRNGLSYEDFSLV